MSGPRAMARPRDPLHDALIPTPALGTPAPHRRRPWSLGWLAGLALLLLLASDPLPVASAANELYVANLGGDSITVYTQTANGNVAPIRTISGASTGLDAEFGLALAPSAAIPTLTEWAQLGMAALLLAGGLWALRRRSAHGLRRRRLGV